MLPEIREQLAELEGQLKSIRGRLNQVEQKKVGGLPLARLAVALEGIGDKIDKELDRLDLALKSANGKA